MKLHSFGKIFSLVAMLALVFALTFAVSVTANAQEAEPAIEAQSEDEIVITTPDLANPQCGKVQFQWDPVAGATTYRVYLNGQHKLYMNINPDNAPEVLYYILDKLEIGTEYNFTVDALANGQLIASGTLIYTPQHAWNESLYEVEDGSCWRVYYCIFSNCEEIAHVEEIHEGLTHVDRVEPTCCQDGNIEYWYCTRCVKVWQDADLTQLTNIKNVVLTHDIDNIEYVEKVEGGCHWDGMNEYWYCTATDCGKVYADAALKNETTKDDLVIHMTDELIHVKALDATCCQDGNVEHWYCTGECQGVWTNEELTQITNHKNVIISHDVDNIKYVAKVNETCHQNGMNEYWYCTATDCGKVYSDAALKKETTREALVIAYNSENVVAVAAVAVSCHQNGSEAYWYCKECETVFADAALTQVTNRKNLVIAYDSENIEKVDAVKPTCHFNGNIEFWFCKECGAVFTDAALTQPSDRKNVVIPCTAEIGHEDAITVTCHTDGQLEFWYCKECYAIFTDIDRTQQLDDIADVVIHYNEANREHVEAKKVDCHVYGNIEYWYCAECRKVFSDEELQNEITLADTQIKYDTDNIIHVEYLEPGCHQYGCEEYWYCAVCNAKFADSILGDPSSIEELTINYTAEINYVKDIPVQCHINGQVEYWQCAECDAVFTDKELTKISNVLGVVVPYDIDNVYHATPASPTCHENGNIEYWHCLVCDAVFVDALFEETSTMERVTIPYNHENIAHKDIIQPGCHSTGVKEYWYCTKCDAKFTDIDLTEATDDQGLIIPWTAKITHYEHVDATCTEKGNIEYWECSKCAATFSDATLKVPTDDYILSALGHKWQNATCTKYETCEVCLATYGAPLGHTEVEIPGVDPTCTETGLTAGKKCTVCNEITVEQETIAALGHNYAYETDINKIIIYDVCTRCGERNPENDTPKIQFTDMLVKIIAISACALIIIIALKALFRPATTTPWYRRRR